MLTTLDIITLKEAYGVSNSQLFKIVSGNSGMTLFKDDLEYKRNKILEKLKNYPDVKIITYWDETYPSLLKETDDPPLILYCKGDISLLRSNCISIVGTRKNTDYGKKICEQLCEVLQDYTTVSGLAYGIDTIVHKNSKKTIAVLACGVDIIYPKSNEWLYHEIERNGLIISEYFPGTQPGKFSFPYRNRIIAGLSKKLIVVEAAQRSGSLITARYAIEYGREVYAVPGDITRINSYGTNYLIYNGAAPLFSLDIFREEIGLFNRKIEEINVEEDLKDFYELVRDGINSTDEICENTSMEISEVMAGLSRLEIKGYIYQENGKYYTKG